MWQDDVQVSEAHFHPEAISISYVRWLWEQCWNIAMKVFHHHSFPLPKAPLNKEKSCSLICVCSTAKTFFLMLKLWVILIIPEIFSNCIPTTPSAVQFWVSLLSHNPWPQGYSKWRLTEAAAAVLHLNSPTPAAVLAFHFILLNTVTAHSLFIQMSITLQGRTALKWN